MPAPVPAPAPAAVVAAPADADGEAADLLQYKEDGQATWLIKYIASHPQVKDIKFQDGIMCLTLADGSKVDMTEPKLLEERA